MKNTFRTIVMLTAVLSMGGFFANQQAMAGTGGGGSVPATAIATIDPSCSLTPGTFDFGNIDTVADAAGSTEITVGMTNSASSNRQSSVTALGASWFNTPGGTLEVMLVGNTQFDQDNLASSGPYNPLTTVAQALATVAPGTTVNTFWIVLAVLNGAQGAGFTGDVDQAITLAFACVPLPGP